MWNIILNKLENDNIITNIENQPKNSGNYLCTCVKKLLDGTYHKYLQIMAYDKSRNTWHDVDHKYDISHNILAWTDSISVCDTEFDYLVGGVLVEKE